MKPTRKTQPHRKGSPTRVEKESPMQAMLKGAPTHLPNPQDVVRATQKQTNKPVIVRSPLYDRLIGWNPRRYDRP